MLISVHAVEEDITPHQAEETHGFAPGFAQSVVDMQIKADYPWGWCQVIVEVAFNDKMGRATLCGCSYKNEQDFIQNSGYFLDMVKDAVANADRSFSGYEAGRFLNRAI